MKKYLSLLAVIFGVTIGFVSPSEATEPEVQTADTCVGAITGPGTASSNGNCVLVAYRYADGAPGPHRLATSLPQTVVDTDSVAEAGVLSVTVPSCYWQLDLVEDDAEIADPLTIDNHYSSNGWLVDNLHGGSSACETIITDTTDPVTTTIPECNDEGAECWDCETMGNGICAYETTTTVPSTTAAAPQVTVLARTGASENRKLLLIAAGLFGAGVGLVLLSNDRRPRI